MKSLQIFKIWGIPFKVHPFWFVILFLFSWSISNQINLSSSEIFNIKEAWLIGFLTSFFLLSSIIVHEIFRTIVSINQGVKIKNITFYFLGAILQIDKECQTPLGNIKIAIVRPCLCFATAFVLFLISNIFASQEQLSINIITRVAVFNLFLGFLNLIPIGTLDGGNLVRSIIWYLSGNKNKGRILLNKINIFLFISVLVFGFVNLFFFSSYYGLLILFLGLFGLNSSRSESQFLKIENILKVNKISEIKLIPLRKIEVDSNFVDLNKLVRNKKDTSYKYLFITNNGRWDGYINEGILKSVSIKKWKRTFISDFKEPINDFKSIYCNAELWKTIERIEETNEGFLLVLNQANIPQGIIDRNKIGYFVLAKLGLNIPSEFISKFNNKNNYPLGMQLPRIINLMKKKGDID